MNCDVPDRSQRHSRDGGRDALDKATFQQILELIVITSVMVALDLSQQLRLLRMLTMMVLDHTSGLSFPCSKCSSKDNCFYVVLRCLYIILFACTTMTIATALCRDSRKGRNRTGKTGARHFACADVMRTSQVSGYCPFVQQDLVLHQTL